MSLPTIILDAVLLAALLLCTLVRADDIQDTLDQAILTYEDDLASIEKAIEEALDALFDDYANRGEFEKAREVEGLKDRFRTEAVLEDTPMLRSIRERAKQQYAKANRELRIAYRNAVSSYTRTRDLKAAEEVSNSLKEFESKQREGRLLFPRQGLTASTNENKSPKGLAANRPSNNETVELRQGNPSARSQTKDRPKISSKGNARTGDPTEELLSLIRSCPERDILSDRLATSQSKRNALVDLYSRIIQDYSPDKWTLTDCEYLARLCVNSYASCGNVYVYPDDIIEQDEVDHDGFHLSVVFVGLGVEPNDTYFYTDGPINDNTPREPTAGMVCSRFRVLWLVSSGSVEEFIERAKAVQLVGAIASVDHNLKLDEFRVWLRAIGCVNREDVVSAVQKISNAGISFSAMRKLASTLD